MGLEIAVLDLGGDSQTGSQCVDLPIDPTPT